MAIIASPFSTTPLCKPCMRFSLTPLNDDFTDAACANVAAIESRLDAAVLTSFGSRRHQKGTPTWANYGITLGSTMKTAISIDDELLQEADEAARLMGLSRSRLFAQAVGDFLQRRRREQMLLRLNEVYANDAGPAGKRLLERNKSQGR